MTDAVALLVALAAAAGGGGATAAALRLRAGRRAAVADRAETEPGGEADRAARLVDALPVAAFAVDADARVRLFNATAGQLFGVAPPRALGRALIEVVPSVDLERMVVRAIAGETETRDLAVALGSRERFLGVSVQPYERGAFGIATDRTAYLAAERVRRDFISDVSHELRTPLTAMRLMLETVTAAPEDAEARQLFLPQVGAEVERMIRLTEDLLELARSESGTMPLDRERFDLREVAQAVAATFRQRAEADAIALSIEAEMPVEVDADRGRLVQVTTNLLDNALRHTPGGGKVTVSVRSEDGDAVLAVRDTGSGIPFADLSRIFQRFYVVDRSRARERGGTGLGLAIAKHLVEEHGGTLTVDSVYGRGATFTMRIPSAEAAAATS